MVCLIACESFSSCSRWQKIFVSFSNQQAVWSSHYSVLSVRKLDMSGYTGISSDDAERNADRQENISSDDGGASNMDRTQNRLLLPRNPSSPSLSSELAFGAFDDTTERRLSPASQPTLDTINVNGQRKHGAKRFARRFSRVSGTLTDYIRHDETKPKGKLQEFTEMTTIHGVNQLFTNTDCRSRCFWITVLLFVLCLVVLQVSQLITNYIRNETVTSMRIEHPQAGMAFPAFSICILSKVNVTATKEKYPAMNKTLIEFSTSSFTAASSTALHDTTYFGQLVGIHPSNGTAISAHHDHLFDVLQDSWGADNNITNYVETAAFDCHGQFTMCWLENAAIFDCCTGIIPGSQPPVKLLNVRRFLVHHGACYEFDPSPYKQRIPGPVGGIGFVYLYPSEHMLYSAFNSYSGYALHLYSSAADAMLERNPTILPVGYHSHVRLQATHSERINIDLLRRNHCQDPKLKYFTNYSYSNCQAECLVDANLRNCNCSGVATVGRIPQEKTCNPREAMRCYESHALAKQINLLAECRVENCREPCKYWDYHHTLAVSRAFNPNIEKLQLDYWRLPPVVNNKSTIDSLIIGEIYFGDIQYTAIEEKAALTLESFVSNIGGAMGLWTGCSIISAIHVIYYFVLRKRLGGPTKKLEIAKLNKNNDITMEHF